MSRDFVDYVEGLGDRKKYVPKGKPRSTMSQIDAAIERARLAEAHEKALEGAEEKLEEAVPLPPPSPGPAPKHRTACAERRQILKEAYARTKALKEAKKKKAVEEKAQRGAELAARAEKRRVESEHYEAERTRVREGEQKRLTTHIALDKLISRRTG